MPYALRPTTTCECLTVVLLIMLHLAQRDNPQRSLYTSHCTATSQNPALIASLTELLH